MGEEAADNGNTCAAQIPGKYRITADKELERHRAGAMPSERR